MQMNKAQIEYFTNAIRIMRERILDRHKEEYPEIPLLSLQEKVGFLIKGEARFKEELFEGDSCPNTTYESTSGTLSLLWEFPGEDERKSAIHKRTKILEKVEKRVRKVAERLTQDFVLKMVSDPNKALNDFENTDYLTKKERETLEVIYEKLGISYLLGKAMEEA